MFFSGKKKLEKLDDATLTQRRARDYAITGKILDFTLPGTLGPALAIFGASIGLLPPFLPLAALTLTLPIILGVAALATVATIGVYKAAQRELNNIDKIDVDRQDIPFRPEPTPAQAKAVDLGNEFRNGVSNTVAVKHTLRLNSTPRPSAPQAGGV